MLFPLGTDALTPHRPWATGGVIAANVLVHVWAMGASEEALDPLVLQYGEWMPWQWLTSVFLHADWFHLLGNMVFLWVFGLVVEGTAGWWRFLAVYGAIAAASGAFEQTVMLWGEGGSLGASGVIYGLLAIAMVWAPENEVDCQILFPPYHRVEVSIFTFGALYLAEQMLFAVLDGFQVGSALLHLIGAAAGLPVGVVLLRRGWVHCHGWDWFSRRDHRPRLSGKASPPEPTPRAANASAKTSERPAPVLFSERLRAGDVDGALRAYLGCTDAERSALPLPLRERLIGELLDAGRTADVRPLLHGVLRDDPGHPHAGLAEARQLLDEGRPSRAEKVLTAIARRLRDARQRGAHADLVARARAMRRSGAMEFDD